MTALDRFADVLGPEFVIRELSMYLSDESPESRLSILTWILKNEEGFRKSDISQYVSPLLKTLCDKTKQIRQLSE